MVLISNPYIDLLSTDDPNHIKVLIRALSVLRTLQETKDGLGLTEISKRSQVNKTTCYRILYTLLKDNIVEEGTRPGTYRLGVRLLELGSIVQRRMDLRQRALPVLTRLAEQTEETVFLCVLSNDKAVCVERLEGKHVQVLALNIGDAWPLYLGAASRALLSGLPDERIAEILSKPIAPKTPKTPTDPKVLWEMIHDIRKKGYSVSYEDVTIGVASIGAPIYNHTGSVVGAISVSSIIQRISPEEEETFAELVLSASREISELMGYPVS